MATAAPTRVRRPELPALGIDAWRLAPVGAALLMSAVYLIIAPKTGDLAAHVFRSELFGREGFTVWNGDWYGGHHTPAYSMLFPPFAWLVGPVVAGAISAVACAALFEPLVRNHFGRGARWGALWFGVATGTMLFNGRLPFALGAAIALASLLALQRGRGLLAIVLALLCPLGSPVAGLFLALAAFSVAAAGQVWPLPASARSLRRSAVPLAVAVAGILPTLVLVFAFPEGGTEPYSLGAFLPVVIIVAGFIAFCPRGERTLIVGAALYGAMAVAAYAISTPLGGNISRLGAAFAAPLVICLAASRPHRVPRALVALMLAGLAYWQVIPSVRDLSHTHMGPSRYSSYYRPLLDFLEDHDEPPGRVEVMFTNTYWETADVAIHFPIARGWERQLDVGRNSLFYADDSRLNARTYRHWLGVNAVRYVAVPDAPLDYSSKQEERLVNGGLPYLKPVWSSEHWRVYEVTSPHPFVIPYGDARIEAISTSSDQVRLMVRRAGSALLRVRWTPYWIANGACVQGRDGWTELSARRPGPLRLRIDFSPARVFEHGRRCAQ
jgi:hypothetical protein